jgi:simple sugar transport system ATP-binding protein
MQNSFTQNSQSHQGRLAVELRGLSKAFGAVVANSGIDLKIAAGSIHAIIGENGAGKSTAMKMLYGMIRPDSGEILIHGASKQWRSPHDAIDCGIGMVHQHFMLAEPDTVLENIVIGSEPSASAWRWLPRFLRPLDLTAAREKLKAILHLYGLQLNLDARVGDLTVGIHQRIEIVKLLYRDANILILDEPTAVLTPQETADLFANLKRMRAEGKTILIITHKLKEVLELADEATIFRAGKIAGHRKISETTEEELATLMVGRKVSLMSDRMASRPDRSFGKPVLEVRDISLSSGSGGDSREKLSNLRFEVRAGEIVGIAGVEGNGQSELLQILLHPQEYRKRARGSIHVLGQAVLSETSAWSTAAIKRLGVGAISEDRHREGLFLDRPMVDSFLLGKQRYAPYSRLGLISESALRSETLKAMEAFDVRPRDLDIPARGFSGGNQQKVIIARELQGESKLLIAAQPTRGVDVGAIEFIHERILEARDRGAGILLVSSELDEVLSLSDRVLVMYDGKIVASLEREQADEKTLGRLMGGGRVEGEAEVLHE